MKSPDQPASGQSNGQPLPTAGNGRDTHGQFAPGNRIGKGNPFGKRVNEIRGELINALTTEDIRAVASALIEKAKSGDIPAVRELFDRTIGKPQEADLIERVEQLEQQLDQALETRGAS